MKKSYKKPYNVKQAKDIIRNNDGLISGKKISFNKSVGIKIWGVVDYLVNHNGFELSRKIDVGLRNLKLEE